MIKIKFNVTKYFLARIFLIITAIIGMVGAILFESYPQLSFYIRITSGILIFPAIIMFEKTKPKA